MMETFDPFEEKLQKSLQSDEMPSPDFSARVMAQVRQTPQEAAVSQKAMPKIKIWQSAACAALVIVAFPVLRLTTMRAGSAAPRMAAAADCAATEECAAPAECEPKCKEAPAAEAGGSVNGAVIDIFPTAQYDMSQSLNGEQTTVTVYDTALAQELRQWLSERGYVDDGGYVLSSEEVQALKEAFPEMQLPDGTVQLILEAEA